MSIGSGIGAASAASEIITLVDNLIENAEEESVLEVLEVIKRKAQQIKEAGDSGWY